MKRTIILHGHLREKLPQDIEVETATVAEALKYLQLRPELALNGQDPYPVTIKDVHTEMALFGKSTMSKIHIYPRIEGGGGDIGAFIQIVVGVVLIVVGLYTGNPQLALLGASLALGGLLQLLTPVPELDEGKAPENSEVINATKNTVKIGTRIPVLYGTRRWAGHYISFNVDATNRDEISPLMAQFPDETTALSSFTTRDVVQVMTKESHAILPRYASQTPGLANVPVDGFNL